jgi:hypothetical protein
MTKTNQNDKNNDLIDQSIAILAENDRGEFTVPAAGLYPHQWLWDSCFIAIGMRHYDIERAQTELISLLRGQWSNGMLPNMILTHGRTSKHTPEMWRSQVSSFAPDTVATSGITQPPMLAEAVVRIGEKLDAHERHRWYQKVYPALLAYHQWLYAERDPHSEGLVLQIHPWETGLDNTPPWMYELHQHLLPFWIRAVSYLKLDKFLTILRKDRKYALPGERLSTVDGLALYSIQRRLRRKAYDIKRILGPSMLSIEDLNFNCILIRANSCLKTIAKSIDREIPEELLSSMKKTKTALEQLWDAYTGQYYSRNFSTHKLIKIPSIATLMPLYAGSITEERAEHLVKLLKNQHMFASKYPVPTVPINSEWFKPSMYWQGPTWVNTNWLIIEGLKRYGYDKEAAQLTEKTLALVENSGFNEYFSPLDGKPAGVKNFSWTAALTIDLLNQKT